MRLCWPNSTIRSRLSRSLRATAVFTVGLGAVGTMPNVSADEGEAAKLAIPVNRIVPPEQTVALEQTVPNQQNTATELVSTRAGALPQVGSLEPLSRADGVEDVLSDGNRSIFREGEQRLPEVVDGHFDLPELIAGTTAMEEIGNGRTPDGFREEEPAPLRPLPEIRLEPGDEPGLEADRGDLWTVRTWAAPNTFFFPRYFTDRMLERHGHERWGCLQPLASGVRFFAGVPMFPYLATVKPPCEPEYTLGYYRPGTPAPLLMQRPPYERRAVIAEGAAVATGILVIP